MSKAIFELCDVIRQTAYELHRYLRHGHLEKIYENGLKHRLELKGLKVGQQVGVPVYDEDDFLLGDLYADLLVENSILVEIKAAKGLAPEHAAQILGYLRSSRIEHGLLLNFGAPKFQIKKYALSPPEP